MDLVHRVPDERLLAEEALRQVLAVMADELQRQDPDVRASSARAGRHALDRVQMTVEPDKAVLEPGAGVLRDGRTQREDGVALDLSDPQVLGEAAHQRLEELVEYLARVL